MEINNRNPEYQFIPTNTDAVLAMVISVYEKIMGTVVRPASPEMQLVRWVADVIIQERALANYTGNQNIPSRAEGANLDALAELTYIRKRPEAKAAVCTVRFAISEPQNFAVLIPARTRVTDAGGALVWETEEDHYIPAGESSVDIQVRCQTAGIVGNDYAPGQINALVDVFNYYTSCANITASDGGSDVPDDETYCELMRASMDAYSCAGARGSYIYWAKQESTEIADVVANSPIPGVVKLYVLMNDGMLAAEEIKSKVLAACSADERRPLTDYVTVEDAEIVPYDINLTYYVPQHSTRSGAEIEAAVRGAVGKYITWQHGKLGRDINPSKLYSLLMETGIKRIDLTSPVFTKLRDGNPVLQADMSYAPEMVPQLARVHSITVNNGGYEDE